MRSCFHPDAMIELHERLHVEAFLALGRAVLSPMGQDRSATSSPMDATLTAWSSETASGGSRDRSDPSYTLRLEI